MANLKEVKSRISSVVSTQQITKAMKMVAAAKLKRAQDRITQMRPYAQKLSEILRNVTAAASENVDNDYGTVREVRNVLIIPITSDKGLCGAFNANVFRNTATFVNANFQTENKSGRLDILPIGKKAFDFYRKRDFNVIDTYKDVFSDLSFDNAKVAAEYAMNSFLEGKYDAVFLVYNEFKNVATQIVVNEQFLPIKQQEESEEKKPASNIDYIYEPSEEEIITELIPKSLKIQFYKALLESNASEHGARMTAMDKATENAGELLKELRLTYNRTRQAAITTEILEIVAGAEALKSK